MIATGPAMRTTRKSRWLALAIWAGFWGFCIPGLAAQEFSASAIRNFGEIFPQAANPEIADAFRGALAMRWPDRKRFRGFSGLHVDSGGRLTAVSDRGAWLTITLVFRDDVLAGATNPVLKRLRGPGGAALKGKDGDAEALATDGRGGFVVAFERRARLLHYPAWRKPFFLEPTAIPSPAGFAELPENKGIEALARLCDGRLFALAQWAPSGAPDAWLGGADGWIARRYRRSDGYVPTGAAGLPDCSVAVLERRGSSRRGHDFRIRRLPASMLDANGTGTIESIALFGPVLGANTNFEGIAAIAGKSGSVLFFLISDSSRRTETTLASFALRIPDP